MTNITIALPEDILAKVQDIADRYHISPEDLIRVTVEELVIAPEESFLEAVKFILDKNKALYERLA
ncbi:MAG: hypothetical protein KDE28_17750 [Anaerolineales bacterium]|nr:hypothetical protein [Anaerolineales bacterium]